MSRGKKWILRGLAVLGILCALGAALVFGLSGYVVLSTRQQFRTLEDTPPEAVDCILVLGCGVYADGTPTPMLSDRLTRGVELYQAGWADKLLMSGDNRSQDYNELATMPRVALEKGVPQADVVLDYAGLSTYDSLYRARDIFGVKKVVIVTQEYHMYRALYLARALGLEAWGVAADGQNYRGQTMRDLREILARDKDVLWAIFQPEPTYLGDPEPLTGTPKQKHAGPRRTAAGAFWVHGTQEGSFTQTKALHPIQWEIRIALRGGLCVVMVDPVLGKEKANRGPVGQVEVRKEVEAVGRPGIFLGGVREGVYLL